MKGILSEVRSFAVSKHTAEVLALDELIKDYKFTEEDADLLGRIIRFKRPLLIAIPFSVEEIEEVDNIIEEDLIHLSEPPDYSSHLTELFKEQDAIINEYLKKMEEDGKNQS